MSVLLFKLKIDTIFMPIYNKIWKSKQERSQRRWSEVDSEKGIKFHVSVKKIRAKDGAHPIKTAVDVLFSESTTTHVENYKKTGTLPRTYRCSFDFSPRYTIWSIINLYLSQSRLLILLAENFIIPIFILPILLYFKENSLKNNISKDIT